MNVICLEEEAFFHLVEDVVNRLKNSLNQKEDKWISGEEVMKKLRISSKTTLQKLRDEGKIRFTQPEKKIILYETSSIDEYLEKHTKNIF